MPKKLTLPAPPVVPTQPTTGNLQDWAQKLVNWALDTRGKIETWSVNSGYLGIVTAEDTYAALAGNSSQTFSVADASTSHEAVSYEQVHGVQSGNLTGNTTANSAGTYTTSGGTFTAPVAGIVFAFGFWGQASTFTTGATSNPRITLDGTAIDPDSGDGSGGTPWAKTGTSACAAGAHTVALPITVSSFADIIWIRGGWFFIPTP